MTFGDGFINRFPGCHVSCNVDAEAVEASSLHPASSKTATKLQKNGTVKTNYTASPLVSLSLSLSLLSASLTLCLQTHNQISKLCAVFSHLQKLPIKVHRQWPMACRFSTLWGSFE
nr:hypothetical protein Iba_chr08aCG10150 [Ipomoea batatas]